MKEWSTLKKLIWLRGSGAGGSSGPLNIFSGDIARFMSPKVSTIKQIVGNIVANQDLHGQSSPYPAGGSAQQWDEDWEVGEIDNSTGENKSETGVIRSKNYISVLPNTDYYFKSMHAGYIYYYDENKEYLQQYTYVPTNVPEANMVTTPAEAAFVRFYIMNDSAPSRNKYNYDTSFNYPATDTDYHRYSNECSISGWESIEVSRTGKNLLSTNPILIDATISNGSVNPGQIKSATFNRTAIVPISKNTIYSLRITRVKIKEIGDTILLALFDHYPVIGEIGHIVESTSVSGENSWIKYEGFSSGSYTYAAILIGNTRYTDISATLAASQLEISSSCTDVTAYQGVSFNIPFTVNSDTKTVYGGNVTIKNNGSVKLKNTHKTIIADGVNLKVAGVYENGTAYTDSIEDMYDDSEYAHQNEVMVMCDKLKSGPFINISSVNNAYGVAQNGGRRLVFNIPNCTTISDFNTWLQNNTPTIRYLLAEPIEYDLVQVTPLSTNEGENNVWVNTGNIEVTAVGEPIE